MLNKLLGCSCADSWGDAAKLILRLALGAVFFMHGYQKIFTMGIPGVTGFLDSLGFPMAVAFAYILAYGELVFGALLILGLLTHWAAKFAGIVAIVAFFTVHMSKGFFVGTGGYEFIILIFAAAVSVMVTGAGKYSLDAIWSKNRASPMAM